MSHAKKILLGLCICIIVCTFLYTYLHSQTSHSAYSPTSLFIDDETFFSNLEIIKNWLPPGVKLLAVMKSDAYGYGIANLVKAVRKANIEYFGIVDNKDILALRQGGILGQFVRLRQATIQEVEDVLQHPDFYGKPQEMIGNLELAKAMNKIAIKYHQIIPFHLNLNAAHMGRNGIDLSTEEGKADVRNILKLSNLKIVGIMSHFPDLENPDLTGSKMALETFKDQANWVINEGQLNRDDLILHMASSLGALKIPESHFDMVRIGAMLYGEHTEIGAPKALNPIIKLKTHVSAKMKYVKGESVGYGRNVILERDSILANIPLGKVNGVPFNLKQVLIKGLRFNCVGAMSMNTTMIDITDHADDIHINDEVVIVGRQCGLLGEDEITPLEIRKLAGMNNFVMNNYFIALLNSAK
ncbi:alanine racemase [Legionella impletisoli]|uniref:Alanine racemase n=1 Tax=Legionella impletisoli TaxID=343510 RepID=A0A917JX91_9GAMM|nr:alanine racemase [Legionella impletisoli]GGI88350.1 alanine racemase [Legionella impletisoli]